MKKYIIGIYIGCVVAGYCIEKVVRRNVFKWIAQNYPEEFVSMYKKIKNKH